MLLVDCVSRLFRGQEPHLKEKMLCVLCKSITEYPKMLDGSPGAHLAWCLATKWHCEYLELANGRLGESRIFYCEQFQLIGTFLSPSEQCRLKG